MEEPEWGVGGSGVGVGGTGVGVGVLGAGVEGVSAGGVGVEVAAGGFGFCAYFSAGESSLPERVRFCIVDNYRSPHFDGLIECSGIAQMHIDTAVGAICKVGGSAPVKRSGGRDYRNRGNQSLRWE